MTLYFIIFCITFISFSFYFFRTTWRRIDSSKLYNAPKSFNSSISHFNSWVKLKGVFSEKPSFSNSSLTCFMDRSWMPFTFIGFCASLANPAHQKTGLRSISVHLDRNLQEQRLAEIYILAVCVCACVCACVCMCVCMCAHICVCVWERERVKEWKRFEWISLSVIFIAKQV